MNISRPTFNPETGMPLTHMGLNFHPSRNLGIALGELMPIPVRDDLARRRLVIPLSTKQEVMLDLGNGTDVSGTDSTQDVIYTTMIQSVNERIFLLSNVITEPKFMDDKLEIGFTMEFEEAKDKGLIVGSPLFPINFNKSVELCARIPQSKILGRSAVFDAYEKLKLKMNPGAEMLAPIGMHVTGATVSYRYPKRSTYER